MRWSVASVVSLALVAVVSGCRTCDRVESELRAREQDVRELRDELERSEAFTCALQHELRGLKGDLPPVAGEAPTPRPIGVSPVRSLALGRQTGGRSDGSCSGDDALQVHVEPRDPDGHAVKVAGSLAVQVLEINRDGLKKPLSAWELSPEQLRKTWRGGLLSSGYQVMLPWKVWPSTEKLRVVAQFRPLDGRVFEAEKDVSVRLPPPDQRHVLPLPEAPFPGDALPPPRPVPAVDAASGPAISNKPIIRGSSSAWRPVVPPPPAELLRPTSAD
jgi:hypothetical protein